MQIYVYGYDAKKKKKKGLPKIFIFFISEVLVYLELCKVSSRLLHAVAVTFIFLFDKYQKKRMSTGPSGCLKSICTIKPLLKGELFCIKTYHISECHSTCILCQVKSGSFF